MKWDRYFGTMQMGRKSHFDLKHAPVYRTFWRINLMKCPIFV